MCVAFIFIVSAVIFYIFKDYGKITIDNQSKYYKAEFVDKKEFEKLVDNSKVLNNDTIRIYKSATTYKANRLKIVVTDTPQKTYRIIDSNKNITFASSSVKIIDGEYIIFVYLNPALSTDKQLISELPEDYISGTFFYLLVEPIIDSTGTYDSIAQRARTTATKVGLYLNNDKNPIKIVNETK